MVRVDKIVTKIRRVETLDLLRGYFLIVIILNHLYYYPSGLEYITGKSALYASSAEGFFLISGIVLGIVRGAKILDKPFKQAAKLLLNRAWQLYLTSIILVILFTLVGWYLQSNPDITGVKSGLTFAPSEFWMMIWQAITLQYTYGWADYLRLYAIFIALAPLALWLLRRGKWYLVLSASFGVWMLYPYSPWPEGWLSAHLSWQIIFFIGFIIGFHWQDIQSWWKNLNKTVRKTLVGTLVPLGFLTLIASALLVFGHGIPGVGGELANIHHSIEDNFNKNRMPIPRILIFGLWFIAFYWLFHRFEKQIKKWFGWILLPFGANSLYVYIIHAFVVYIAMVLTDPSEHWWINLVISLACIGIIHLALKKKFLTNTIPR